MLTNTSRVPAFPIDLVAVLLIGGALLVASSVMDRFVARANIDHYLGLLNDADLAPEKRATVTKLLIQEEDRLSHDLEQLEFAETRAADGRDRLHHLQSMLDSIPERLRSEAKRLIVNVEDIQILLEGFCHQLRNRVNNRC